MAFKDAARLAKDGQNVIGIHVFSYPFTRLALETQALSLSCEIIRLRCFKSQTSTSISSSVKSGALRIIDKLWILVSLAAIICAISASEPGELIAEIEIRAGNLSCISPSISQRISIQRSG